jgi:beta-N-acetylhexosaminidase
VTPRLGELLAVGFEGATLPEAIERLADESGLGGVVLFARNCPTVEAVRALTAAARRLGPDVLVLVDHEGGRVHRLPPPFTRFPPAAAIGRAGDPALAAAVARAMARELRAAGFDSGLTPVLDCLTNPRSAAIGDRAYSADPEQVAACGAAFVEAALAEGLLPVAKHFPGHGRTPVDSHFELPEVPAPVAELEATELAPFRRALAAGCPAVMVAHVRYTALDPEWPASLSAVVVRDLLRGRLAFPGLVVSDDLDMKAVAARWGTGAAAARFIEVGGDLALVCRDPEGRAQAVSALHESWHAGRTSPAALVAARRRRVEARRLVAQGPRADDSAIGCVEHRELVAEILGRGGSGEPPATS